MKRLIEHFVRYPILSNIIIAVTLIAGILTLVNTKKSFFPTTTSRNIVVQVFYPGASPEEMEDGVTLKIEEAIYNIVGVDEISSTSSENSTRVNISTLKGYDIDEMLAEIKNAVDGISSFPVDAEKPTVYKVKPQSTAQWVGLTGDVGLNTLKTYAEKIEDDMLASGIISQVNLSGFNPREISIEVPEATLQRYGLTFDQVANAVRQNNRDISAGSIKAENEEILIRSKAKKTDADLLGEIVLRSNDDGSKLLLRDIADIREQFSETPNGWTLNGKQAVFLEVRRLETEDLESISNFVHEYAEKFNAENTGVELVVAFDFLDYLGQRIEMLTSNGMIGLLLVLLSLGTFLSIRLSLWVAWGIPASFFGMFIIGAFYGLTINMLSLFGMILVIGILVDDGIVIAENIYTHFEKTRNPVKAAINGTMEVFPAVFTSVTTTIVAFFPFMLLDQMQFFRDVGFVVVASLAFSLLEAFFVLPAHLSSKKVLTIKAENTRSYKIRSKIQQFIDWMRHDIYGRSLRWTMKYRVVSFAIIFALFPITIGLMSGGLIKSTIFPNIPFSAFQINVAFKPGTRENVVNENLVRFEKSVWAVNEDLMEELDDDEDFINFTFSGIGSTMDGSEQGSHVGGVQVFYKELDGTGINAYDLINRIRDKIGAVPGAEKFTIGGGNRFGKPVSVRIIGEDLEELKEAKDFMRAELNKMPDLKDITDDLKVGRREMLFDLTNQAYFLGLTYNDITSQMRQGFFGEEVQRLQKGDDEVKVWVRYPNSDRLTVGQLEDMKIKTAQNEQYPLNSVANYRIERGISGITHQETKRTVTVEADLVNPNAEVPPIQKEVREQLVPKMLAAYPGVSVDYGGQSRSADKAVNELVTYFSIALCLIVVLIMIHFKSFHQGMLIISMIPLGWIGAIYGHGIHGLPVSLFSALGMIALTGVIINDAVVFLAKYNSLIKNEGLTVYEAAYRAGIARFRAIMLTSITTVVGLFPIILEKSFQAQFLIPVAVSVAYGVLIGTFIILLFFPVLILLFNDFNRAIKWLWEGKKPSREEVERVIKDMEREKLFEKVA